MTDTPRRRRRTRTVEESRMTLVEHLVELRSRVVKSLIALLVGFVVAFVIYPHVFALLQSPYCDLPPEMRFQPDDCRLYFFGVAEGFVLRMQLTLLVGALLASPIWLYQLAAFIAPGLHENERRWTFVFVGVSVLLFAAGTVFAYLTLPMGLRFLLGFGGEDLVAVLGAKQYLSFLTLMLLAFGVSFEFPLVLVFLVLVGVLDAAKLRRLRRAMYFGVAALSAVITPSQDPITFLAMWIPMVIFYECVVLFARVHGRRKAARAAREGTEQWADDETSQVEPAAPVDAEA